MQPLNASTANASPPFTCGPDSKDKPVHIGKLSEDVSGGDLLSEKQETLFCCRESRSRDIDATPDATLLRH